MDLSGQKNGLNIEDPLERLRDLFRSYLLCVTKDELGQAGDIWENKVPIEMESIGRSCPEISLKTVQSLFFEEKRRLQDHDFLVDAISEKITQHLNQMPLNRSIKASEIHAAMPHLKKSNSTDMQDNPPTSSNKEADTSKELSGAGFDLTSMIDSMLEGERAYDR